MSCWPDYAAPRRERFSLWRRNIRERLWRQLHPRQAAAQDARWAAEIARLSASINTHQSTLFAPHADVARAYSEGFTSESPVYLAYESPPVPWYRRAYWRVSGWVWRVIEAL